MTTSSPHWPFLLRSGLQAHYNFPLHKRLGTSQELGLSAPTKFYNYHKHNRQIRWVIYVTNYRNLKFIVHIRYRYMGPAKMATATSLWPDHRQQNVVRLPAEAQISLLSNPSNLTLGSTNSWIHPVGTVRISPQRPGREAAHSYTRFRF